MQYVTLIIAKQLLFYNMNHTNCSPLMIKYVLHLHRLIMHVYASTPRAYYIKNSKKIDASKCRSVLPTHI